MIEAMYVAAGIRQDYYEPAYLARSIRRMPGRNPVQAPAWRQERSAILEARDTGQIRETPAQWRLKSDGAGMRPGRRPGRGMPCVKRNRRRR